MDVIGIVPLSSDQRVADGGVGVRHAVEDVGVIIAFDDIGEIIPDALEGGPFQDEIFIVCAKRGVRR